jgi:hypothetical protein
MPRVRDRLCSEIVYKAEWHAHDVMSPSVVCQVHDLVRTAVTDASWFLVGLQVRGLLDTRDDQDEGRQTYDTHDH